eukprot:4407940-Prymnesium_polylepis.1
MSCPSARSPSRTTESVSRRSSYSCRFAPALLPTAAALPCAEIAYIVASDKGEAVLINDLLSCAVVEADDLAAIGT